MQTIKAFGMTVEEAKDYCKDRTLKELAEHFGLTEQVVKNRLSYYGLYWKRTYNKKVNKDGRNEMIKFLATKFTYEQIGKEFGMSKQRVEQIIRGA